MEELLKFILENIVDHPEDIKINIEENELGFLEINFSVHPEDMGQVIGKQGKTISAIRKVLKVKAVKLGKRFSLNITEPQKD